MKNDSMLKTTGALVALIALTSIGQVSAVKPAKPLTASQLLSKILADDNQIPLVLYPPGFLDELKSLGNSVYPPPPTKSISSTSLAVQRNGPQPMDLTSSGYYAIVDLGTLPGGTSSYAQGINDNGQVVGYASTSSGYPHAFLYSKGSMQDLGTLGGLTSYAQGINDSGQIVGYSSPSPSVIHAFLYDNGTMQDIGTLGGSTSYAYGINNHGQVVGNSTPNPSSSHAFLYDNGTMQDLGTLGGVDSSAQGINDSGQIVGYSYTSGGNNHAFLYSDGIMQDLGTLGGSMSTGTGINNLGQVVGGVSFSGNSHAFLYSDGIMQDLGTLGGVYSYALGINNSEQIVGCSTLASSSHAFLYSNGTMKDLNNLVINNGWFLQYATSVNAVGQIAGYGYNPSYANRAFRLDPCFNLTYRGFHQGDPAPDVPTVFGNADAIQYGGPQSYFVGGRAKTIYYGCALCSAASMLTSFPGLEWITPAVLDAHLTSTAGAYIDGDNVYFPLLPKAMNNLVSLVDSPDITDPAKLETYLENHCCGKQDRVILRLTTTPDRKGDGHYILVVGRTASDWLVFDPGWTHAYHADGTSYDSALQSLSAHLATAGFSTISATTGQLVPWHFYIAGVRTFRSELISAHIIAGVAHSPVEILVTNPNGKRVGYDPATSNDVFEVQGASYVRDYQIADDDANASSNGDTNGIKTFCIPSPLGGTYQAQLTGTAQGSYTFDVGTFYFGSGGQPTVTTTGTTDVGITTTNTYFVIVPPVMTASILGTNTIGLSFTTQSNVMYIVEGKSTVDSTTTWATLQTLVATGSVTAVTQSISGPMMFFRIRWTP